MDGYDFYHVCPETSNKCGGVGIYMRQNIGTITIRGDLSINKSCNCAKCQHESLWLEIQFDNLSYIIGGIYRHPNGNVSHFTKYLTASLGKIDRTKACILAGDFNIT